MTHPEGYDRPSPSYSDEYYLAMAALDQYPIEDRLPKSTSIVFRIHQLGHELERLRGLNNSAERLEAIKGAFAEDVVALREILVQLEQMRPAPETTHRQLEYLRAAMREALSLPADAPDEDIIDHAAERWTGPGK